MPSIRVVSVLVGTALGGCVAASGGAGQMISGEAVVGEIVRGNLTLTTKFCVRRIDGTSCYALLADGSNLFPEPRMNREAPLQCNDGRKGLAILSANQFQDQVTMIFRMPNGERGSVTFGRS